jgi:predicted sugar kinase
MNIFFRRVFFGTIFLLLTVVATGFAHGEKDHEKKISRVTAMKMMKTMSDSTANGYQEMSESMMTLSEENEDAVLQKDIEQIISETKNSATAIVIKVSSLILALAGIIVA